MGLTKQYRRYAASGLFNVVGSTWSGIQALEIKGTQGKYAAVGACEHVFVWDLRKGEKVMTLEGDKHQVSALAKSPDQKHLAAGYSDGTIKVFNLLNGDLAVTFTGHKSAVTALNYDHQGMRLVSGSKDTEVIVWDIVNEAGLFRLRGHKGVVTQARFLKTKDVLITSSKDTFVKFWDLETQHCFKTLVGHKTEVWDFIVGREESLLITGSTEMDLSLWRLAYPHMSEDDAPAAKRLKTEGLTEDSDEEMDDDDDEDEESNLVQCERLGSIMRHGKDRVVSMALDPSGKLLGFHGNDSTLELFKVLTEEELGKHLHKRQKKARKKARESGEDEASVQVTLGVEDEVQRLTSIRMGGKVRAFQCILENPQSAKVIALLNNNTIESCSIEPTQKKIEPTAVSKLNLPSHRTDVRTLSFSSDNTAILSASGDCTKIWNRATLQCIRTMACEYALCSLFAPGDRHIVLGTKSGKLQIFDIAAGSLLESVEAHSGAVWSVCLAPDKKSIVSGSADKEVKFWDFELITDKEFSTTSKRLTLVHTRTLKMSEDILCVKYSPDGKFLAVSLLDNTVKVFFVDTLKFFLSLYGHKLPVLCMDISTDGSLIVTGSADRNVKLWGLDFGDCHKSIFAHDDSIMCVQFVPKTHMFFTGGKDGKVKEWDADNFQHIITLEGHHAEVWCLAVSPSGNFVVSGSHDKSLRLWEKTLEPLVLEEEREMEREKEHEEAVGEEPVIAGETNKETGIAAKKTAETVKAAERLMEALEVYREEEAKHLEHDAECKAAKKKLPAPPVHPLMQAFGVTTPASYVLEILKKIKSSELEESLLVLPFSCVTELLPLLRDFIQAHSDTELAARCLLFLLRIHQGQITSNQVLLPVLDQLRTSTKASVDHIRDTVGFNLAGLQFLQQQLEEKEQVTMFADATDRFKQKRKKVKKRAILTVRT